MSPTGAACLSMLCLLRRAPPAALGLRARPLPDRPALSRRTEGLALERHLVGLDRDLTELVRAAAEATPALAGRAPEWLPELRRLLDGRQGTYIAAPAHRLSSAQQSAPTLREGPRRQAYACETGDWSHVDVHLTKTTDYRLLLLAGSPWEDELMDRVEQRGSTVVAVGGEVPGVAYALRYRGDTDDDVRLLTETLVAELLASRHWLDQE